MKILLLFLLPLISRAELVVVVSGAKNDNGKIGLLVFHKAEGFPDASEKALHRVEQVAKKGSLIFKLPDLNPGSYAFVVLHDENKNQKLDKNFIGYPKEGFAISNYSKIARPKFAKALVENPMSPLKLKLLYP
ncbi:DUF2141 domain-containing protein, partial [Akkermansiaceae bacterium]|nr:DUF2141 domain-containing protein [Akkermansiaceae bacterium]MDB4143774.1 DUF2141 domain-containing protein [Akkermansiaceae bacterium]MDB4260052.1 DUF2141 domain-containing protein [Akkermansiaceae bacterium]MDB4434068.1 DUF2141 domain-containing protein [Akkermansiaceae bacterium]